MISADYISNSDILLMLATRMKEYRLAARLSQRELAEKSGVSYTTICRFEQGKHPNITLSNFIALLRQVGMESRMADVLPELPVPPMALREINKLIPKRVRRHDTLD
ncbi:MAG: helix-turn-helix domain-containing protein [Muribaculaceae bacterium]|nr:helix-turn-helix domain-containing protein [Muribaculaceae bacterium]